jgi:hypothetical protein
MPFAGTGPGSGSAADGLAADGPGCALQRLAEAATLRMARRARSLERNIGTPLARIASTKKGSTGLPSPVSTSTGGLGRAGPARAR